MLHRKNIIITALLFLTFSFSLSAAEAGTGFSLFFPESFYHNQGGTISVENGLSTSIGLGKIVSIPIGFSYNKIQGFMVEGSTITSTKPWFMGDSFMGYVMVMATLPLGFLFLEAYGGGGINWNATLTPFRGNIADDLASSGEYAVITELTYKNSLGYGWLGGSSIGITIKKINIKVDFLYRDLKSALDMRASYDTGSSAGSYTAKTLTAADARLVIRGFTVGLSGSFSF